MKMNMARLWFNPPSFNPALTIGPWNSCENSASKSENMKAKRIKKFNKNVVGVKGPILWQVEQKPCDCNGRKVPKSGIENQFSMWKPICILLSFFFILVSICDNIFWILKLWCLKSCPILAYLTAIFDHSTSSEMFFIQFHWHGEKI